MKLLRVAIAAFVGSLLLCGCLNKSLVKDLSRDNATVVGSVTTIYGSMKVTRSNPGTNHSVTVAPDGTVTIKARE